MLYTAFVLLLLQYVLPFFSFEHEWDIYDVIYILVPMLISGELFMQLSYRKHILKRLAFLIFIGHIFYLVDYVNYHLLTGSSIIMYAGVIGLLYVFYVYYKYSSKLKNAKSTYSKDKVYLCYQMPKRFDALLNAVFFRKYGHCFLVYNDKRVYFKNGTIIESTHAHKEGCVYVGTNLDWKQAQALAGEKWTINKDCFYVFEGFADDKRNRANERNC